MIGVCNLSLRDAGHLPKDPAWWAKRPNKEQLKLALACEERQKASMKNLVFDNFAPSVFWGAVGSGLAAEYPYSQDGSNGCFFAFVCLLTSDYEPTYQEVYSNSTWPSNTTETANNNADNGAAKLINQTIETPLYRSLPAVDGREGIHLRMRWLWLPYQGISSNIRSVGMHYRRYSTWPMSQQGEQARSSRVLIKDSGGTPLIINKTSSQVLLVEWNFYLLNV